MANEMRDAIKGNDHSDIRKVAIAGDAVVAANASTASSATTALGTAVKGTGWTAGMTLKAHDDSIAKLNLMYVISFPGVDASEATAFVATTTVVTPGATATAGDKIIGIISARLTADQSPVAIPAIVATDASNGFVQALGTSTGVKVKQGVGANLSANTYYALVLKA